MIKETQSKSNSEWKNPLFAHLAKRLYNNSNCNNQRIIIIQRLPLHNKLYGYLVVGRLSRSLRSIPVNFLGLTIRGTMLPSRLGLTIRGTMLPSTLRLTIRGTMLPSRLRLTIRGTMLPSRLLWQLEEQCYPLGFYDN